MDLQDKLAVPGEFRVTAWDVRDFSGDWRQIEYGDPHAPRIAQLRQEFDLDTVVAGCESEFAAQCALKRWVRSRWDHGWSHSFETVKDGLDVLREAARGEQFSCGFYNTVFRDCATALGWPTRGVGISIADDAFPRDYNVGNVGHSVPEIWSNEFEKWVLMDPDANAHYELGGEPLSALEIRDAWLGGYADDVLLVIEEPPFVIPSGDTIRVCHEMGLVPAELDEEIVRQTFARFTRHRVMDYYARVRIAGWTWVDERLLPGFVSHFEPVGTVRGTSNRADMYWTVNMTRLSLTPSWEGRSAKLAVTLEHCMPWFDHFQASVNGAGWQRVEARFDWPMREGMNALAVRAVNARGRAGIPSGVEVAYAVARW